MIHVAGPMIEWVQRCTRCDVVLNDYRNAAWPEGQPAPTGFEDGAHIDMETHPGFRAQMITEDPPDCERVS